MIDKSVPYAKVLMRRTKGAPMPALTLPAGFSLVLYKSGDEADWAAIETSVGEFTKESDALARFAEEFMPFLPEVEARCLFIENSKGEKVATGTAWRHLSDTTREPQLHWVAVRPEYQGLGLGKAITAAVTLKLLELEGDADFYLSTQTWSHKAIRIYEKAGYAVTDENALGYINDEYEKALAILAEIKR